MKSILSLCVLLTLSFSSFSSTKIQNIVDDYYSFQKLIKGEKHNRCTPKGSCFKTACDSVGTFECNDQDEMDQLRRACRGVWGADCITASMSFLHSFEYDDIEEMSQLVESCRGLYETDCITYSCDKLNPFGCDDLEEIIKVNRACAGY